MGKIHDKARERGKEVIRLKDAKRWTFREIAEYLEISSQRAHQIYWEQKIREINVKQR